LSESTIEEHNGLIVGMQITINTPAMNNWLWSSIIEAAKAGALAVLLAAAGCSGSGPAKSVVLAKDLNPDEVAARAMTQLDANGDGQLDGAELAKSPPLQAGLPKIDKDKSKSVSAAEIADRIRAYQSQSQVMPVSIQLMKSQQPVANAEVTITAPAFVGDQLPTFKGTSDEGGVVTLATNELGIPGLPVGLYEVQVSGTAQATIGCEVAEDTPQGGRLTLSL
jgi:hypothetical protein